MDKDTITLFEIYNIIKDDMLHLAPKDVLKRGIELIEDFYWSELFISTDHEMLSTMKQAINKELKTRQQ